MSSCRIAVAVDNFTRLCRSNGEPRRRLLQSLMPKMQSLLGLSGRKSFAYSNPRAFCRRLVCLSRSSRYIECTLGRSVGIVVSHCEWPDDAGCPSQDIPPTVIKRRLKCPASRLPAVLRAEAGEAGVVMISGLEMLKWSSPLIEGIREFAKSSRYLMLCAASQGSNRECFQDRYDDLWRKMGIQPAFTGYSDESGQTVFCALTGREATLSTAAKPAKTLALMRSYNEVDIIEQTIANLFSQGLDVFVADDGSTDGTVERLESIARSSGRLVLDKIAKRERYIDSALQYSRLLEYARQASGRGYEWMMTVDADEIRCSPWPDTTLAEAFAHVARMGYNAVDFTVLDFRYAKGQQMTDEPYENQMRHFEFGTRPGHFRQIKAWRQPPSNTVDLFPSGGHEAVFEGRRVFPLKFLLKHYPLRGLEHARKKIYQDRLPRYEPQALAGGAHVQYNAFRDREPEGWDVGELDFWDDGFYSRCLLERLSGVGLRKADGAPASEVPAWDVIKCNETT